MTPARLEIAGSDARIWLRPGQQYDQLGVSGVLTGKLATTRTVLGEPFGVRAALDIDALAEQTSFGTSECTHGATPVTHTIAMKVATAKRAKRWRWTARITAGL